MSFKDHFLDPQGQKFDTMLVDLENVLQSLKTWWNNPDPIPEHHSTELNEFKKIVKIFPDPFPLNPENRNDVFKSLLNRLQNNLRINVRNMAQQHPTPILESLIASFLVSIQNPNSVYNFVSPAEVRMEKEVISWISNMIGFQHDKSGGNVVSGGSIANLTALSIARNKIFRSSEGVGFVEAGAPFLNIPLGTFSSKFPEKGRAGTGVILSSPYAHYSVEKSCKILGFGDAEAGNYFQVGLDSSFNIDTKALESYLERLTSFGKKIVAVVSIFGTTETGLIEPIDPIIKLRDKYGFFYLIDAAHGGWALSLKSLDDEQNPYRQKIEKMSKGIEQADAITIDPHKLGFLHYPAGCIILRDKHDLKMIHQSARYLAGDESYLYNPGSSTIEGSRPGSPTASIWTAIKTIGMKGYAELIKQCLEMTDYLSTELQKISDIEVINPKPDLNLLCFRIKKGNNFNDTTQKIHDAINASRKFYVSATSSLANQDILAIRMCIMNPYTTTTVIDDFVTELQGHIKNF